jgi:DNA (cytosine-5)-methyltransferase 1
LGYQVSAENHFLNSFGLPQRRERALVIAAKKGLTLRTLSDLWAGTEISPEATTVRRAIGKLPKIATGEASTKDPFHIAPNNGETGRKRLMSIPPDGGSWISLRDHPDSDTLLTPAMKRYIAMGKFGSHPDVYGRLFWDSPAVTIKRECGHTGNGRYAHPEQHRLCSIRELAILQGFPRSFRFGKTSVGNMYRHIGDAVPPLISYQIAHLCEWIITGKRPSMESIILPDTHLTPSDFQESQIQHSLELSC